MNLEKIKEQKRQWYFRNKDRILENNTNYNIRNKDKIKEYQKIYKLKTRYNLTLDQYNKMLSDQNNCCKVCDIKMIKPIVDHCHTTGKVRGLLCNSCNVSLGRLKEDTRILNKMIEYIKEHNNE
jgi:hypothetical protein